MRTLLSLLGIVIGVASIIAITTLGRSATLSVQGEIARNGLNTMIIQSKPNGNPKLIRLFSPELAVQLQQEVDGIELAMPMIERSSLMKHGETLHTGEALAVNEDAVGIFDLVLAEGRFITPLDRERRSSCVVLGAGTARKLFPTTSALGRSIRLYLKPTRTFRVVGVLAPRPDGVGISFDHSVFIPFETYSRRIRPIRMVDRYAIGVKEEADPIVVSRNIEKYFLDRTGTRTSIYLVSPSNVAEMFNAVTTTLNAFLTGVAAISLLVGGIGIMNIMFVSVSERTKEIGIRKALGASPKVIRGQFLIEAVTLTLFGGILGAAFGTGMSYSVTWLFGWTFAMSPFAYPLALLFSSAVGIFFGMYPAVRASRLEPVQALSYE